MKKQRLKIEIETAARLAALDKSQREIANLTRKIEQSTTASYSLSRAGGSIRGAFQLGGAIAGFNLLLAKVQQVAIEVPRFTRKVIEEYDALDGMINAVSDSQEEGNAIFKKARDTANELGLELTSTAKSYVRMKVAGESAGFTAEQIDKVFDSITKTGTALSLGNEEIQGTFRALEQMMSKGNVQAEELRGQLGERLPGAFNLAARAMGVTTQELNKMLDNGEVLALDLLPKLADVLDEEFAEAANQNADKLARNTNRLTNEVKELVNVLARPLSEKLSGSIRKLADQLKEINEGLRGESGGASRFDAVEALYGRQIKYQTVTRGARSSEKTAANRERAENRVIEALGLTDDQIAEAQEALDRVAAMASELDDILIKEGAPTKQVQNINARGGKAMGSRTVLDVSAEERARLSFEWSLKQLRTEKQVTAEKTEQASAERDATDYATFQAKLKEGVAELERKQGMKSMDVAERLKSIDEERLILLNKYNEAVAKEDLITALKAKSELLKIEAQIEKLSQTKAADINELARLQGLQSVGNGRFVDGNLTLAEKSRASVEGQSTSVFNPLTGAFESDNKTVGGLNDAEQHLQSVLGEDGALQKAIYDYQAAIGTLGDQMLRTFDSLFQSIDSGISSSIEGLINGTMSWGDALQNIRTTIVSSIVSSFSEMAAEWITQQIVMDSFGRGMRAKQTGEVAATAAVQTAAWTPTAIASSIATVGGALAAGLAASTLIAGFADGGFVTGPGGPRADVIPAMLSNGEFVVNAAATSQNRALLEAINSGRDPRPAANPGGTGGNTDGGGNVTVAGVFNSESAMEKFLRGSRGQRAVLNANRKSKHRLFPS